MVQLVLTSDIFDATLSGLAVKLGREMESGARPFKSSITMNLGVIKFQKLGEGRIRAVIFPITEGIYRCTIGVLLTDIKLWMTNYVTAKLFARQDPTPPDPKPDDWTPPLSTIPDYDVWTEETSVVSTATLNRTKAFSVSVRTASAIVAQHNENDNTKAPTDYILVVMEGVVRHIIPVNISPYKGLAAVHVPSWGKYPAAFYQNTSFDLFTKLVGGVPQSTGHNVKTTMIYPVIIPATLNADGGVVDPEKHELRTLALQGGFMQVVEDPNIAWNYGVDLIQLLGGLSGAVTAGGSVYAVYFKNNYTGQQRIDSDGVRRPAKVTSTIYIAGANEDKTFDFALRPATTPVTPVVISAAESLASDATVAADQAVSAVTQAAGAVTITNISSDAATCSQVVQTIVNIITSVTDFGARGYGSDEAAIAAAAKVIDKAQADVTAALADIATAAAALPPDLNAAFISLSAVVLATTSAAKAARDAAIAVIPRPLAYNLDLLTLTFDTSLQKVACLIVPSTGRALFHFFHWVGTNVTGVGVPKQTVAALYFTTVSSVDVGTADKTGVLPKPISVWKTKELWKITDGVPKFDHPSLESWYQKDTDPMFAPAFFIQQVEDVLDSNAGAPLPLLDGTDQTVAAFEDAGVVTITSNITVPFSLGAQYPNGVFVYDIDSGAAAVTTHDFVVPPLHEDPPVGYGGDPNLLPLVGPTLCTIGGGAVTVTEFYTGKDEDGKLKDGKKQRVAHTIDTTTEADGTLTTTINLDLTVTAIDKKVLEPYKVKESIYTTVLPKHSRIVQPKNTVPKDGGGIADLPVVDNGG